MKIFQAIIGSVAIIAISSNALSCRKKAGGPAVEKASVTTSPLDSEPFRTEIRQLYNNRKFAGLEEIANRVRSGKERFADGDWKIYHFHDSLDCQDSEAESMWKLHETIHAEWEKAYPDSITARVATARFYVAYAWHARSSQYADKVTDEGWSLFNERLAKARTVLDQSKSISPKCPVWWSTSLKLALGQQWPREEYNELFNEAKLVEPEFFIFDIARANFLLPRWYGKPGEWEKVTEDAIKTQGASGPETYARVITYLSSFYGNIFTESKASWRKTRQGYEDMLKHYPGSMRILNNYCRLACLAGDKEKARELFGLIGENKVKGSWKRKNNEFETAKAWANSRK